MNVTTFARDALQVARGIAGKLTPAENNIDTSLATNADLLGSIVRGRLQVEPTAAIGHDAIMSAAHSIMALATARDHTIRCHQQLSVVRDHHGLSAGRTGCTINSAGSAMANGQAEAA